MVLPAEEMRCERCRRYVSIFYCPVCKRRWCVFCTPSVVPEERNQRVMCPFCRRAHLKTDVQSVHQACYVCGTSWGPRYVHVQKCANASKFCFSCSVEWPHKCSSKCPLVFVCDKCAKKERGYYAVTERERVLSRNCPRCGATLAR
jgi:hypothetical protein